MASIKTPPTTPKNNHCAPPSPNSIWTPVDAELEALCLGWDELDIKSPKGTLRSFTPPSNTADPSGLNRCVMTDPRPKRDHLENDGLSRRRVSLSDQQQQTTSGQPQQLQKQIKYNKNVREAYQTQIPKGGFDYTTANQQYMHSTYAPGLTPMHFLPQCVPQIIPQNMAQIVPSQQFMYYQQPIQQMPSTQRHIQVVMSPQNPFQKGPYLMAGQAGSISPVSLPLNTVLVPATDVIDSSSPNLFRVMTLDSTQQLTPVSLFGNENSDSCSTTPIYPTMASSKIYCLVEFKRGRTVQYESANYIAPGQYVIVGGDRGEDLGMIVHSWVAQQNSDSSTAPSDNDALAVDKAIGYDDSGNPVVLNDQPMGRVIRLALPKEVHHLHNVQTELEKKCMEVCQQKVIDHGLVMEVVDAEYQFDRKKLTFYYNATERQDFRDLVRDLYKTYRARIWMAKAQPAANS